MGFLVLTMAQSLSKKKYDLPWKRGLTLLRHMPWYIYISIKPLAATSASYLYSAVKRMGLPLLLSGFPKEGFANTLHIKIAVEIVNSNNTFRNTVLARLNAFAIICKCHYSFVTRRESIVKIPCGIHFLRSFQRILSLFKEGATRASGKLHISGVLQFSMR